VYTKFVVSGSFGGQFFPIIQWRYPHSAARVDIGGALYGPWMRYLILGSIVVSQIGFVSAYIIFVSQNLQVCGLVVFSAIRSSLTRITRPSSWASHTA
jgi:amino acid permease